ncbi:MAG: hypothetical protein AAGA91_17510 [Pseudomonadota bacterium]
MGDKVTKVLAILASALLLLVGLRWIVDPAGAAAELGMPLLEGLGRSTQIGDLTAFFVVAGCFGLFGTLRRNSTALAAAAALVGGAAVFRTLAWAAHDAALAPQILVEIVMLVVFLLARRHSAAAV